MEIWNSRSLDNNQRFIAALLAGLIAAVVLGLAYGILFSMLRIQMSILYVAIGYAIGWVIRKFGRGVHQRFAVLGALMTLLAIIIGDLTAMTGFPGIFTWLARPSAWGNLLSAWLRMNLSTNISSLLGLLLRAFGVYEGYLQSVIL